MKKDDRVYLSHILQSISSIKKYAGDLSEEEFLSNSEYCLFMYQKIPVEHRLNTVSVYYSNSSYSILDISSLIISRLDQKFERQIFSRPKSLYFPRLVPILE